MTVENIVTEDQRAEAAVDKVFANDECLSQTIRGELYGVLNI
jgi:hypothetical protein